MLEGRIRSKNGLISDGRSEKVGTNIVYRLLITRLLLKLNVLRFENLVTWMLSSRYANKGDMMSQLQG